MTLYTDALNTYVEGRTVLMICILFTIASSQVMSKYNSCFGSLLVDGAGKSKKVLMTTVDSFFWKFISS